MVIDRIKKIALRGGILCGAFIKWMDPLSGFVRIK